MKVLIAGASGLVGNALVEELMKQGNHEVSVLTRNPERFEKNSPFPIKAYAWDPDKGTIDAKAFENAGAIINLAGENVASRWTAKTKKSIYNSRINGTRLIYDGLKKSGANPKVFVSAGAIGIYGDRGDEELLEENVSNEQGFLINVCRDWEKEVFANENQDLRKVVLRTGIVLSEKGGALKKMLPPFLLGAGGRLGSGKQYMSWIHIEDLVRLFIFAVENDYVKGPINAVSPKTVTNSIFTKTLGNVIKRPTIFPVPAFVLNLAVGEMSSMLLGSQNVSSKKAQEYCFEFKYEGLMSALENLLGKQVRGELVLERFQYVPHKLESVFDFFSNEKNLEKITPPFLGFQVLGKNTPEIQKDTYIDYKLSLHGLPMKWTSRISDWKPGVSFVDEQITGPYSKWHHTHNFFPVRDGTVIQDKIVYRIPGGWLGRLLAGPFINNDLKKIFDYRRSKVSELI